MNNKERLERLINDIEEQSEVVSKEPHLMINIIVNAETFIPLLHNIKEDLDRLEKLEKENARLHTKIKKLEKELENADDYIWELTKWDYL